MTKLRLPIIFSVSLAALVAVISPTRAALAQTDRPRFTTPQLLLPDETKDTFQLYPSAVKYEDSIYLTWSDFVPYSAGKIYFSKSRNKGRTFSSPVQVSPVGSSRVGHPEIAVERNSGKILVVWQESSGGNRFDLLLSYSTDQGESFSSPMLITTANHSYGDLHPAIAAFEDWVYLFWEEEYEDATGDRVRIMLSVSSDSGGSFSSPREVAYWGARPRAAVGNQGWVYLTYLSFGEGLFFFSEDHGQTFQAAGFDDYGRIAPNIGATSRVALVISDDGKIHLAWSGYYRDCEGIVCSQPFYRRFSKPREPDTETVEVDTERISLYAGNRNLSVSVALPYHVFIYLERFADGTYFYPSADYGASFGERIKVSTSDFFSSFDNQIISFGLDEVIVFWDEFTGDPETSGIYYASYIPPEEPTCIPGSLLDGDTNCDCEVNIFDLVRIGINYGKTEDDPDWDPLADIVSDGRINIFDLVRVGVNYGRTCPQAPP